MSYYDKNIFYIIGTKLWQNYQYENYILCKDMNQNQFHFDLEQLKQNYTNKLTKQLFDLNNELDSYIQKYNSNKNNFVTESFEKKIILLETIIYRINQQLIKTQCPPNP